MRVTWSCTVLGLAGVRNWLPLCSPVKKESLRSPANSPEEDASSHAGPPIETDTRCREEKFLVGLLAQPAQPSPETVLVKVPEEDASSPESVLFTVWCEGDFFTEWFEGSPPGSPSSGTTEFPLFCCNIHCTMEIVERSRTPVLDFLRSSYGMFVCARRACVCA